MPKLFSLFHLYHEKIKKKIKSSFNCLGVSDIFYLNNSYKLFYICTWCYLFHHEKIYQLSRKLEMGPRRSQHSSVKRNERELWSQILEYPVAYISKYPNEECFCSQALIYFCSNSRHEVNSRHEFEWLIKRNGLNNWKSLCMKWFNKKCRYYSDYKGQPFHRLY